VKWSDLPVLTMQWREGLFNWGEDHPLTERVNLTDFTAKLSTRSDALSVPHFSAAKRDMQMVFEMTPDNARELDRAAMHQLQANVPVAAQWVFYAGKEIYACEIEEEELVVERGLWKGKGGLGKQRWGFWKDRAGWVAEQKMLSKGTRDIAE
jgi:hypothetical protein